MKKIIYLLVLLFSFGFANAQSNYYYYNGKRLYLNLDKNNLNIFTDENFQKTTLASLNFKDYNLLNDKAININQKFAKLEFQTEPTDLEYLQKINSIKQNSNIKNVSPYFKSIDGTSIGISNIFYIKIKKESDLSILQQFAIQKNVEIVKKVEFMPFWYILKLNQNTSGNTLEITNQFYESNLFADVDPAFMFDFKFDSENEYETKLKKNPPCTNDTNFSELWGLNNTANPNIDINACQAWTITQGADAIVAVIDQGIDMTHQDLVGNFTNYSFDTQYSYYYDPDNLYNTSYSRFVNGNNHGTHVAGIISAVKDNNLQVTGVAPQSQLMGISNDFGVNYPSGDYQFANGISWATSSNAMIINNSWGASYDSNFHSSLLENSIINAMTTGRDGLGTIIVFASGNRGEFGANYMGYPGNFNNDIIVVGSSNENGQRSAWINPNHESCYGDKLDVVAPGTHILSTLPYDSIGYKNGTSMAAPHVSGVCALILSINPCLSGKQVRDIIEKTSQKVGNYTYSNTVGRPNGTWNNEVGYGLIDAFAAVQLAQAMNTPIADLMVRDGLDDFGIEPNPSNNCPWNSCDIWVRNQIDNIEEHENPEYNTTNSPNYVYVRVTNKGCEASTGLDELKLYWSKASSSLTWPSSWDGTATFSSGALKGAPIGTLTIPVIQPGKEKIIRFDWNIPDPALYGSMSDAWHYCLLARIESINDPMHGSEFKTTPGNPNQPDLLNLLRNVKKNNNIAWKNVSVVNLIQNLTTNNTGTLNTTISVENLYNQPKSYYLELVKEDLETGKNIYDEAEIIIKMDQTLYNAWDRGGKVAQRIEATFDEKKKIVKGNNVILDKINFMPNEVSKLTLSFNFLTKEITDKTRFVYHVLQKDALTNEVVGGETYIIKKPIRNIFTADAGGNKIVDKNKLITISASQINEPAIYNWYDTNGNLIYQGKDILVSTDVAKKYKLEVIATSDGFKDYTDVDIKLKPSSLGTISPNPATNNVTINYKLNEVTSAYLMIIGSYGSTGTTNNYILDSTSSNTNLNIANYPAGFYTIALVCNGQIVDAKTLIKE